MTHPPIITHSHRPMPSREERLASAARHETAMACMWAMCAAFCAIWSYALSMGGKFSVLSVPLGIAALTLGVLFLGSFRNALHHRRLLEDHRHFLNNMKPTNRV